MRLTALLFLAIAARAGAGGAPDDPTPTCWARPRSATSSWAVHAWIAGRVVLPPGYRDVGEDTAQRSDSSAGNRLMADVQAMEWWANRSECELAVSSVTVHVARAQQEGREIVVAWNPNDLAARIGPEYAEALVFVGSLEDVPEFCTAVLSAWGAFPVECGARERLSLKLLADGHHPDQVMRSELMVANCSEAEVAFGTPGSEPGGVKTEWEFRPMPRPTELPTRLCTSGDWVRVIPLRSGEAALCNPLAPVPWGVVVPGRARLHYRSELQGTTRCSLVTNWIRLTPPPGWPARPRRRTDRASRPAGTD